MEMPKNRGELQTVCEAPDEDDKPYYFDKKIGLKIENLTKY